MSVQLFFARVLLVSLLFLPWLVFGRHVDGAFAGHTETEARIWLRSGLWVSEPEASG